MDVENQIQEILDRHDTDEEIVVSTVFPDGGVDPLFPRLARAALNQADEGGATFSRYAIWANTVRDNLREASDKIRTQNYEEAERFLRRSINALSAFSEIQALFDERSSGNPTRAMESDA